MPQALPSPNLELSAQDFRALIERTLHHLDRYIDGLKDMPVSDLKDLPRLARSLREPLPQSGIEFDKVLNTLFNDVLPKGIHYSHPGMMGGIPVGGLLHTAVAQLITGVIDRWPGLYNFAPGFIEIENTVLGWLAEIVGMPADSGGNLTSGGSLANTSAIYIARNEKLKEKDLLKGTVYGSDQAHHSILRGARMAGIPIKNVRMIPSDSDCRISLVALEKQIQKDRKKGLKPFLLVGAGGTVTTGAVDDLTALARIAKRYKLWFHTDAAWAGAFPLTRQGSKLMAGMGLSDSITIDPHKVLFMPFGCGALIVRDKGALKRAFQIQMSVNYLPTRDTGESDSWNPSDTSPELSRTVRGLQVWLPLKMLGIQPFADALEEKLQLAHYATRELIKISGVELFCEPQLCIIAFRFTKKGVREKALGALNSELLKRINADGAVMLTEAMIKGKNYLRLVPFGYRTHQEHVDQALDRIRDAITAFTISA